MVVNNYLPPLFHLPLFLAWQVSLGHPESTKSKKTSSNTEKNPEFALENMSKSCWQPSHFHMALFPSTAARLGRLVTHAWAVIISHAGVSKGSLDLPWCIVIPRSGAGFHWCWWSEGSGISPPVSSASPERAVSRREHTARHATAQLSYIRHSALELALPQASSLSHTFSFLHLSHAHCCHPFWCCSCWSGCWIISCSPHSRFLWEFIPLRPVLLTAAHHWWDKRWKHTPPPALWKRVFIGVVDRVCQPV